MRQARRRRQAARARTGRDAGPNAGLARSPARPPPSPSQSVLPPDSWSPGCRHDAMTSRLSPELYRRLALLRLCCFVWVLCCGRPAATSGDGEPEPDTDADGQIETTESDAEYGDANNGTGQGNKGFTTARHGAAGGRVIGCVCPAGLSPPPSVCRVRVSVKGRTWVYRKANTLHCFTVRRGAINSPSDPLGMLNKNELASLGSLAQTGPQFLLRSESRSD